MSNPQPIQSIIKYSSFLTYKYVGMGQFKSYEIMLADFKNNSPEIHRIIIRRINFKMIGFGINRLMFTSLVSLKLSHCGFDADMGLNIANCLRSHKTAISNLDLSHNPIGEKACAEIILALGNQSEAISLNLENTLLRDTDPIALALEENNRVIRLNLSHNSISENKNSNRLFKALLHCSDLTELNISNFGYGSYGCETVFSCQLGFYSLSSIDIIRVEKYISDRFCASLVHLIESNKNLRSLNIKNNLITFAILKQLRNALEKNNTLIELILPEYCTSIRCNNVSSKDQRRFVGPYVSNTNVKLYIESLCRENQLIQSKKARDWARISVLISFIRANQNSEIKYSILPLIPAILELAAIKRIDKPEDYLEQYAIFLRENLLTIVVEYLALLYTSGPLSDVLKLLAACGLIAYSFDLKSPIRNLPLAKSFYNCIQAATLLNVREFYIHVDPDFETLQQVLFVSHCSISLIRGFISVGKKFSSIDVSQGGMYEQFHRDILSWNNERLNFVVKNVYTFLTYSISCSYFTTSLKTAAPIAALIVGIQHKQPQHKETIHTALWLMMSKILLSNFTDFLQNDYNESVRNNTLNSRLQYFGGGIILFGAGAYLMYRSECNKINRNLRYPISLLKYSRTLLKYYSLLLKDGNRMRDNLQYYASSLKNLALGSVISTKKVYEACNKTKLILLSDKAPANLRNRASEQTAADGTAAHTADRSHDKKIKPKSWCGSCTLM